MLTNIESTVSKIFEYLIFAVLALFGWLLKRSIYGHMDEMKDHIDKVKSDIEAACIINRSSCKEMNTLSFKNIYTKVCDQVAMMDGKLDRVIDQIDKMSDRLDKHIDKKE